jgi:hypothetical protein
MSDLDRVIPIEQVSGVEGPSLYIDGLRVAGNKPWGGGSILATWQSTPRAVLATLAGATTRAALAALDPSEEITVEVADGHISIAGRNLATTPGERFYPRNARWKERRIDLIESLAQSVRYAKFDNITADIHNEVAAWHQQHQAAEWALALDLLFAA